MVSKQYHQLDKLIDNMTGLNTTLADLNEKLKTFPNTSWSIDIKAAEESSKVSHFSFKKNTYHSNKI